MDKIGQFGQNWTLDNLDKIALGQNWQSGQNSQNCTWTKLATWTKLNNMDIGQ